MTNNTFWWKKCLVIAYRNLYHQLKYCNESALFNVPIGNFRIATNPSVLKIISFPKCPYPLPYRPDHCRVPKSNANASHSRSNRWNVWGGKRFRTRSFRRSDRPRSQALSATYIPTICCQKVRVWVASLRTFSKLENQHERLVKVKINSRKFSWICWKYHTWDKISD